MCAGSARGAGTEEEDAVELDAGSSIPSEIGNLEISVGEDSLGAYGMEHDDDATSFHAPGSDSGSVF